MTAQSPFLLLPTEIRLLIYEHLLVPQDATTNACRKELHTVPSEYHYYEGAPIIPSTQKTLQIRTLDPLRFSVNRAPRHRTTYDTRCDRFRARTLPTTYFRADDSPINPSILLACRQCHAEAASLLYSAYTFDFDTHVEAIIPFLSDLTPLARSHVRSIRFVKRGLPYDRESDRAEWAAACAYLTVNVRLWTLEVGVVAGKPALNGWESVRAIGGEELRMMVSGGGDRSEELEWVGQLMAIRGLKGVDVKAIVEHCPLPVSERMAFWVALSKSVEGGLRDVIKEGMLG